MCLHFSLCSIYKNTDTESTETCHLKRIVRFPAVHLDSPTPSSPPTCYLSNRSDSDPLQLSLGYAKGRVFLLQVFSAQQTRRSRRKFLSSFGQLHFSYPKKMATQTSPNASCKERENGAENTHNMGVQKVGTRLVEIIKILAD